MTMKRFIPIIPLILALVLSSCGQGQSDQTSEAPGAVPETTTAETTTTTAPAESVPETKASAGEPGVVSPEDEEQLKDGFRALFGHKTNAQKEQEQYWSTYTTTQMTTTDHERFLEELKTAYTLTVDDDYVVHRTVGDFEDSNVGWEIFFNGEKVLGRNAENELTYRWDTIPGEYTYYLTAFVDGQYETVSNTLTFTIDQAPPEPTGKDKEIADLKQTIKVRLKTWHMIMEDGAEVTYEYTSGYILDTRQGIAAVLVLRGDDGTTLVHYIDDHGMMEFNDHDNDISFGVMTDPAGDRFCIEDSTGIHDAVTWEEVDPGSLMWPKQDGRIYNDTLMVSRDHVLGEESMY